MALGGVVNPHNILCSLKTRILYKSVENNISKPSVCKTRSYTTSKSRFKRSRIVSTLYMPKKLNLHNICSGNICALYLHSRTLNSFTTRRDNSSNQGRKHNPIKNDVFRLSQNETGEILNKINTRIEERYAEVKQKANVVVDSIKSKVNKSTGGFAPLIFGSEDTELHIKAKHHSSECKSASQDVNELPQQFSSNISTTDASSVSLLENSCNEQNDNPSLKNTDEVTDELANSLEVYSGSEENTGSNVNLQKIRNMVSSLENFKSTSSYKHATSFTENTLKKAARRTDNLTSDLQETITSIKDKITNIPKIDQFTTLKKLKGKKVKSAAERNQELPSPQGKVYTLEDTLLKMGEMSDSTVNVVSTTPSMSSNSDDKTTSSKMKKYLEQTMRTVKRQENIGQKQNMAKSQVSKISIDNRAKALSIGVRSAETTAMKLLRVERLAEHLLQYPESRHIAFKEGAIASLLKMQKSWDKALLEHTHMCLALLGYVPQVRARGLRVLTIDGGGARGVIPIVVLRELERRTNCRIRDMFDYIMGVSSGGVLAFLLTFGQSTLDECAAIYRQQSLEVFKRNSLIGTGKLFLNHAFYDTEGWTNILKTYPMAKERMIEFAKDPTCPKVATVATLINHGALKDFLFRNYNLPAGVSSRYRGSSSYPSWQALRASSAAPGYFEEHKIDDYIFQDGGVLTNNPTALALHECKLLWPHTPIQCVISLGTGRWDPKGSEVNQSFSTLKEKLIKIMLSATDTQSVHTVMNDLLPPKSYYRFNPYLSEDFDLDENRPEKLVMMENDIRMYLDENEQKITDAVTALMKKKTAAQKVGEWMQHQKLLYVK